MSWGEGACEQRRKGRGSGLGWEREERGSRLCVEREGSREGRAGRGKDERGSGRVVVGKILKGGGRLRTVKGTETERERATMNKD